VRKQGGLQPLWSMFPAGPRFSAQTLKVMPEGLDSVRGLSRAGPRVSPSAFLGFTLASGFFHSCPRNILYSCDAQPLL